VHPAISLLAIVRTAPLALEWRKVNKPVVPFFSLSPHPLLPSLPSLFHAPLSSEGFGHSLLCAHLGISTFLGFPRIFR